MDNVFNLGALRAKQSNNAGDWSAVDCLRDVLASIENGDIDPKGLIVCMYEEPEPGIIDPKFSSSMPNILLALGTLHLVETELMKACHD